MSEYDCQKCGSCCRGLIVPVYATDKIPQELTKKDSKLEEDPMIGTELSMKRKKPDERCVCLAGTVGKRVSCRIYENRPEACRGFKPGSSDCQTQRYFDGFKDAW